MREAGDLEKVPAILNLDVISNHEGGEYKAMVSQDLLDEFLETALQYTTINWTTLTDWEVSDHRRFFNFGRSCN